MAMIWGKIKLISQSKIRTVKNSEIGKDFFIASKVNL